nr:MAG TPA: hypothetical protein [Caudoviricetes sp.]DAY27326.1 MAG TPA: hypothetical protein [Caudoviricetes sp.]
MFFIYGNKAISFTIKELMTDFDKVTTRLKAIEP